MKASLTTLLLGTLLTIPADKVYVSYRTLKYDIFVWFLMCLCKSEDLNNLPQHFQGPKSCDFRFKMSCNNLIRSAMHTSNLSKQTLLLIPALFAKPHEKAHGKKVKCL